MSASIRPIVTTSFATSGASAIRRIKTRSIATPRSGAATSTVRSSATNVWMPGVDLQLPIDERHDHADGALGEVEDPEVVGNEAWLCNVHIAEYTHGNRYNHVPTRRRKLLLHRREIDKLIGKTQNKGLTLILTKLYLKGGYEV